MIKELSIAKKITLSNFKRLSKPYKLTYAITYKCNSRCKICGIWEKRPKNELTTKQVKEFFTNNNYFNWIDITGGEVFLRLDLVEIVEHILTTNKNLYMLHIPTNCLLPERIESEVKKILKLKPHRLILTNSIDGPERVHDDLRGVPGNFMKVVETYKKLSKYKSKNFEVYLGMTISHHNYNQIDNMYEELKSHIPKLETNDIHFNIAHQSSHYYGKQALDTKKITNKILTSMCSFLSKRRIKISGVELLEREFQSLIPEYLKSGKSPLPCQALSASFFMDSWGNIYPCTMWGKKISNIKDINLDLKKIWFETNTIKTREKAKKGECPGCWTPCEAYQTILANQFNKKIYKSLTKSLKKPTSS